MRFTVRNIAKKASMRVEMASDVDASEVARVAAERWGMDGFIMRNGYYMVPEGSKLSDHVSEGDTIDLITDPRNYL
jgi:hypothetical protein